MLSRTRVNHGGSRVGRRTASARVLGAIFLAMVSGGALPGASWAEGILEAISGNVEEVYNSVSTKTRDASGATTKTGVNKGETRYNS